MLCLLDEYLSNKAVKILYYSNQALACSSLDIIVHTHDPQSLQMLYAANFAAKIHCGLPFLIVMH